MSYTVVVSPHARRQHRKLPTAVKDAVDLRLSELEIDPRPGDCKKLRGQSNQWRIRVGDYRIAYEIEDSQLLVFVIEVGKREHFY